MVFNCMGVTANSSVSNETELLVFNCVGVMAKSIESNEPELLAFSGSELRVSSDVNWFDFLSWPKTKGHFLM